MQLATKHWVVSKTKLSKAIEDLEQKYGITVTTEMVKEFWSVMRQADDLDTWNYMKVKGYTDEEVEEHITYEREFKPEPNAPGDSTWAVLAEAMNERQAGVFAMV